MSIYVYILPLLHFIPIVKGQLEIKACCGGPSGLCQSFSSPESLFGTACCGNAPFNSYSQLCCSGIVRERNRGGSYAELCCGTEVLRYDQTCCEGVVHNVVNGDCCGKAVYSKMEKSFLCCNETLARTTSPSDVCCGSTVFDGGRSQICCGDRVSEKTLTDSCCEKNDGTFVQFKSSTHFCCNGAVPRGAKMSCCYMRMAGQIVPEQYNTDTNCCKYPYDRFYPKAANGQCAESRKKRHAHFWEEEQGDRL